VSPTHGEQEMSVWNGHYACTCYHPLFVFNQFGDLERCALRPGKRQGRDQVDAVVMPDVAFLRVEIGQCPEARQEASMTVNKSERLRRNKEFEVAQNRLRASQIETMIAEFDRICINLGHQIEAEEARARISDPAHFAYPTYAKAARERRAKLQLSADALKIELDRLRLQANEASNRQFAA
jgi:hypothetical protein